MRVEDLGPSARRTFDTLKTEEEKRVFLERQDVYGDPEICHANIGACWAALLSQHLNKKVEPIPPHVVALMMSSLKLVRSVRKYQEDNYLDASVYNKFAQDFQFTAELPKKSSVIDLKVSGGGGGFDGVK